MGNDRINESISSEMLAAYLDGHTTGPESRAILDAMQEDASLQELFYISQQVDDELCKGLDAMEILPMTALAASCEESCLCCLECEKYILKKNNVCFDEKLMLETAVQNGWLKEGGTALHNVGRHLEQHGMVVVRQYKCGIADIVNALEGGDDVIVAVDGGELLNNGWGELREDLFVGQLPDHIVVVLACDMEKRTITLYDPNTPQEEDVYSLEQFMDAWDDSKNYLVTINSKEMKTYIPKPIDLSDVVLDIDLTELREAIAENAHEIWAVDRQREGWTYGPKRDQDKKETPCMVPYSKLPEKEKEYDRKMAMNTLKLVRKMGYDFVKREETELYKDLLKRIRDAKEEFCCPRCKSEGIITPIFRGYVYCPECSKKLDIDWSQY